ncbi:MAG: DUF2207 domain-containing protein [Pseudomonadota bacterium]
MRIYKSGLAALLLFAAAAPLVHADERILSYDSTITVNRDGTLQVREMIRVRAEGNNIRRGIFRDFPTTYPANDGRQIVVGFSFESATRDGQNEPWRTEAHGNGIRIYLGSAAVMLPHGEHLYELNYRTDRQMGYFADHDELYWNATGNGWGFDIDHATARVLLPDTIPRKDIKLEAYTGPQGTQGKDFKASIDNGAPFFETTSGLGQREGLTIVAMWPKGFIMPAVESPSVPQPLSSTSAGYDMARDAGSVQRKTWGSPAEAILRRDLPHDRRPVFIALAGLALLLGYYYFIWNRVGRDPPGRVIIPEYEMPAGQSAASMRYLLRMSYDNNCFAAGILSLAVKGYLRIEQESGILGIGKTFTLVREAATAGGGKPLSEDEKQLLTDLFESGDSLVLKKENHSTVNGASSAHKSILKQRYKSSFFKINGGWHFLGILLSLLLVPISMAWPGEGHWPQWYFQTLPGWVTLAAVAAGLISNGVFGWLLKAPTIAGRTAMDHIEGFKMYLEVAEGEDLKRITAPPPRMTPQLYESYLPAALALDVEQRWAQKFAKVLEIEAPNYSPAWYVGSGAFNAANIGNFSSQLGSSLSSAISSASVAPGSSSGGGGGGSSGGGGGGGGGGGW